MGDGRCVPPDRGPHPSRGYVRPARGGDGRRGGTAPGNPRDLLTARAPPASLPIGRADATDNRSAPAGHRFHQSRLTISEATMRDLLVILFVGGLVLAVVLSE